MLYYDLFAFFSLAPLGLYVNVGDHGVFDYGRERHEETAHEKHVNTLDVGDFGQASVRAPYERDHCQHSCNA